MRMMSTTVDINAITLATASWIRHVDCSNELDEKIAINDLLAATPRSPRR